MNKIIDRLGDLNENLKALEKEKEKMVKELKASMTGKTAYGTKWIARLSSQDRSYLDKTLIPESVLTKATIVKTVVSLHLEKK
jgi:hypothetical protein